MSTQHNLSDQDFRQLLDLRTSLRTFQHWSEEQARTFGLTSTQHQLLLAVRGHPDRRGPTIGEVARYLVLRPHSAVGLVDRAAAAGLVERLRDGQRPGTVRLKLTPHGATLLDELAAVHLKELVALSARMEQLCSRLGDSEAPTSAPGASSGRSDEPRT